jgi:hypothetical protein
MYLGSMGQNISLYVSSGPGDDEFLICSFTSYNVKYVPQIRTVERPHMSQRDTCTFRDRGSPDYRHSPRHNFAGFLVRQGILNMNLAYFSMRIDEPYSSCHSSCPCAPLGIIKQCSSLHCNEKDRSRRLSIFKPNQTFPIGINWILAIVGSRCIGTGLGLTGRFGVGFWMAWRVLDKQ